MKLSTVVFQWRYIAPSFRGKREELKERTQALERRSQTQRMRSFFPFVLAYILIWLFFLSLFCFAFIWLDSLAASNVLSSAEHRAECGRSAWPAHLGKVCDMWHTSSNFAYTLAIFPWNALCRICYRVWVNVSKQLQFSCYPQEIFSSHF